MRVTIAKWCRWCAHRRRGARGGGVRLTGGAPGCGSSRDRWPTSKFSEFHKIIITLTHSTCYYLSMPKYTVPTNPSIAVAYIRVSKKTVQELGPGAQRAAVTTWASTHGVQVVSWHVDQDVSGVTPMAERPALLAALAALRCGPGLLLVAKRDRIARDVVVAALIDRAVRGLGASLVSVDGSGNGSTPTDEFMRVILDGSAAYERSLIIARTKAALAVKKARGERTGQIPYGQRLAVDGVRLEEDPDEQDVIAQVRSLRAQGLTTAAIVEALRVRGYRARSGNVLGMTQVARIFAARTART